MIAAITNHLWQSTLFVLAAGVVAFALRKNGAHIRHRVWMIASLKFLVPFSLLMSVGSALPRPAAPVSDPVTVTSAPAIAITVNRIAQPFTDEIFLADSATSTQTSMNWTAIIVLSTWAAGFAAVAIMRLRGWSRIRAAVRASTPLAFDLPVPVRSAPGFLEPGVVGLWRPVMLMPAGIEQQLTPSQLNAVVAHELCHVQRRDNLTSAIHMVVEAVYWFHPLVWVVGARLVDERERACDEHVLRVVGQPQIYAEGIINVCKLYVESPLACVSGVSGADLKKRIAAIVNNRVGVTLTSSRRAALTAAAIAAMALPLAAGAVVAPIVAARAAASSSTNQSRKFEVASIKSCDGGPTAAPGQRTRTPGAGPTSPGYLYVPCMTLAQLTNIASGNSDDFLNAYFRNLPDGSFKSVRGGPDWVTSDRFTIEARAEGTPDRKTMQGPMLLALLEDRFQLKMHRATEDQGIYVMTVAAGGLKIAPLAPGACWEFDPEKPAAEQAKENIPPCGMHLNRAPFKAGGAKIGKSPAAEGTSLASLLSTVMDRPVLDQTGLDGRYDVEFDYTPDETTPHWESSFVRAGVAVAQPPPSSGPNIFKALEKLGLKLEPKKWPVAYLVIDHAERPKPNDLARGAGR